MFQRIFFAGLALCGLFYGIHCIEGADAKAASLARTLLEDTATAWVLEQVELPAVSAAGPSIRSEQSEQPELALEATTSELDERAVLAFLRSRHTGMSRLDEENVARTVVREARRHDLDPALVLAVIQVESGGYYHAISHVGAMGLMQLLPATAKEMADSLGLEWHGPESLFDPVMNVRLGTAYIKRLADRFGDVSTALAAYNWGPTRIDQRIRKGTGVPSIYIERVMKAFDVALSKRQAVPTSG
jgi:soluble lytic murein transglycosylase-like protein